MNLETSDIQNMPPICVYDDETKLKRFFSFSLWKRFTIIYVNRFSTIKMLNKKKNFLFLKLGIGHLQLVNNIPMKTAWTEMGKKNSDPLKKRPKLSDANDLFFSVHSTTLLDISFLHKKKRTSEANNSKSLIILTIHSILST